MQYLLSVRIQKIPQTVTIQHAIVNSAALPTSGINLAVVDDIDCQPGRKLIRNRHV
jgi:hypothetical protein